MSVTISPHDLRALSNLGRFAREAGLTMRDVGVDQARLLAQDLINRTPPLNKKMKIDEAAGRNAIRTDAARVIKIMPDDAQYWDSAEAIGTVEIAYKTKSGRVYGTDRELYKPYASAQQIADHVARYRSKTTGRVTRAGSKTKNVGRWKFVDALHVNAASFAKYLDLAYTRLGQFAAGWKGAAIHFAQATRIPSRSGGQAEAKIPSFVARHAGDGGFIDAMTTNGGGQITLYNNMRYGNKSRLESLHRSALRTRERDMTKWMQKRLAYLIDRHNGRQAA